MQLIMQRAFLWGTLSSWSKTSRQYNYKLNDNDKHAPTENDKKIISSLQCRNPSSPTEAEHTNNEKKETIVHILISIISTIITL